jgi:hypothetical protein
MKKQTAVEWLDDQLEKQLELFQSEWEKVNKLFDQAKAMEKEQIVDSHIAGMEFIAVDPSKYKQDAEQYYNETYKGVDK